MNDRTHLRVLVDGDLRGAVFFLLVGDGVMV